VDSSAGRLWDVFVDPKASSEWAEGRVKNVRSVASARADLQRVLKLCWIIRFILWTKSQRSQKNASNEDFGIPITQVMSWKNVVVIPCHNEEVSIREVIADVRRHSPTSDILVVDNASTDQTAERARSVGARVVHCPFKGKGRALKFGFSKVQADSYTIVDGDSTYDLSRLEEMIQAVKNGTSMCVGERKSQEDKAYPPFHRFGNWLFTLLLSVLFGREMKDVLSGLRVFSREFVEGSPIQVKGFEVEAFYSLEAAIRDLDVKEFSIKYFARPEGGQSKLRSFRDGFKILFCVLGMFRLYRPLHFYGMFSGICFFLGTLSGFQPILEFVQDGYVYAVPRAILAASLMNLCLMFFGIGAMLDAQMKLHLRQLESRLFQNRKSMEAPSFEASNSNSSAA